MKKFIARLALVAMAIATVPAQAATFADNLTVTSSTYVTGATTADISIAFNTLSAVAAAGTIDVTVNPAVAASFIAGDVAVTGGDLAVTGVAGNVITLTTTVGIAAGQAVTVAVTDVTLDAAAAYNVTVASGADSNSISMTVVPATSFSDTGTAVVTAVVLPGVSIAVTNTNTSLGALDAASVSSVTGTNITASANTPANLYVYASSANAGLYGATTHNVIAGATAIGSEGFALTTNAGTNNAAPVTNQTITSLLPIATKTAVVTGGAQSMNFDVTYLASIAAATEADNYSTTITYTATTTF